MTKMTKTLMGTAVALALAAGAGVAPAFAGTTTESFTQISGAQQFSFNNTNGMFSFDVPVNITGTMDNGILSINGTTSGPVTTFGTISSESAINSTFSFANFTGSAGNFSSSSVASGSLIDQGNTTGVSLGNGTQAFTFGGTVPGFTLGSSSGFFPVSGGSGSLTTSNPVPEASTVVSFGALLALGGLAVLRRKSVNHAA